MDPLAIHARTTRKVIVTAPLEKYMHVLFLYLPRRRAPHIRTLLLNGMSKYCGYDVDDRFLVRFAATAASLLVRTGNTIRPQPAENLATTERCSLACPLVTLDASPSPAAGLLSSGTNSTRREKNNKKYKKSTTAMLDLKILGCFPCRRSHRAICLLSGAAIHHFARRCSSRTGAGALVDVVRGSVEAFLREMTPGVDGPLVGERVGQTTAMLRSR